MNKSHHCVIWKRVMALAAIILPSCLCVCMCSCVSCFNNWASTAELLRYIRTCDHHLNHWTFTPDTFDWEQTNKTYSVEFSPLRARAHVIYLEYDYSENAKKLYDGKQLTGRQVEDSLRDVRLRISISHCSDTGTTLYKEEYLKNYVVTYLYNADKIRIRIELAKFIPDDFPWHYNEQIMVILELLCSGKAISEFQEALGNGKLIVSECYPIY